MGKAIKTDELAGMPLDERLELVEAIWDSIAADGLKLPFRVANFPPTLNADAIVAALQQGGAKDAKADKVTRYKVRPGSIEVWLSGAVAP